MGVVKDGTVSGVLPTSEVFAVNYPGYPSTTSRAIETLGGTEGIIKARTSQTLALHFRPEDPYSHPVIGRLHSCNNFLLKLSKKTSSVRNEDDVSGENPSTSSVRCNEKALSPGQLVFDPTVNQPETIEEDQDLGHDEDKSEICADIVAQVSEEYCFDGMADYQHVLAVHADAAQTKKRKWADMEPHFQKSGIIDLDRDDLLMILPPFFSIKDTPEQVVLKPSSSALGSKKKPGEILQRFPDQPSSEIERIFFVDFNVEDVPRKIEWEKSVLQGTYPWECQMAVCKLFEERPIWPKRSLAERLRDRGFKIQNNMLRRLLFNAAYYFSNGPFHRFWIRRGYDPRNDPGSCIYQRIDFRVPPSLRGYCDANAGQKYKQKWSDLCAFKCFPYGCQLSLQFFELEDDYIQQEIIKPLKQSTCSRAAGWLTVPVINHLRLRIAVRLLSVCPEPGAAKLLKTCKDMFEKTKRKLIFESDKSSDKQAHKESLPDEETADQQAQEEILADDEEEEIEEADDEPDDYEENDEYEEAPDLSGEEDEIPLQPYAYNMSANYLQNIFDTFPSAELGRGQVPDTDASDGEYQIYEPYSNDDDDDHDDGNSDND
uniref:Uncharacterized protein n=1 Tax=Kalanchoe fedtschenkoi TaxID=63787 RepID=A0A7N0VG28_KALFE